MASLSPFTSPSTANAAHGSGASAGAGGAGGGSGPGSGGGGGAHPSLIAQTLNADGTPKRPMNAFMIFARRRRPQVSAQNQMMRTGEISKILSKEWGGMGLVSFRFLFLLF